MTDESADIAERVEKTPFLAEARGPFGTDESYRDLRAITGAISDKADAPDAQGSASSMDFTNDAVADNFEKLVIPRQVPGYNQMRYRANQVVLAWLSSYVDWDRKHGIQFLDLGCSTGLTIRDVAAGIINPVIGAQGNLLDSDFKNDVRIIGIDNSEEMILRASKIQENEAKNMGAEKWVADHVMFRYGDLVESTIRELAHDRQSDIISSILTVQFLPPEQRPSLMSSIYENLRPGGLFVLVEKHLEPTSWIEDLKTDLYYDDKRRNGMTDEAILKKKRAIERILIPITRESQMQLLTSAGFRESDITTIWKDLAFEMLVARK